MRLRTKERRAESEELARLVLTHAHTAASTAEGESNAADIEPQDRQHADSRSLFDRRGADTSATSRVAEQGEGSDELDSDGSGAAINPRAFEAFVYHRFKCPLDGHARWAPWYGRAFTALSVLAIVAGIASSALASQADTSSLARWFILALGLVVGAATAVNQIWRPAQRSVTRYRAARALRQEAWDYVNGRGHFAGLAEPKATQLFLDEVTRIHRTAEAVDEIVPEVTSSSTGG